MTRQVCGWGKSGFLLTILIVALLVGRASAQSQAGGELTAGKVVPLTDTDSSRDWHEDDKRVSAGLEGLTPPNQYLKSLQKLGVLDQLRERGTRPQDKSFTSWSRVGPVGGFGPNNINGRIAGIQTVPAGFVYYLFAGSTQGGLWRTRSDLLYQWTDIGRNLPNPSVRAFAVDPDNPNHIFVGTGDYRRYTGAGMFETTNNGATWTSVTLPFGGAVPAYFYRMLYLGPDPTSGLPRMVAATFWGPIYSTNGGSSWARGNTTSGLGLAKPMTDLVQDPADNKTLFAVMSTGVVGGESGVYVSHDYGKTWAKLPSPVLPPSEDWDRASLAICRDVPTTLVVLVSDGTFALRGVYKTVNAGSSWSNITNELITTSPAFSFGGTQVFHAQAIAISPVDPNFIVVGTTQLATSSNGGNSWNIGQSQTGIAEGHADFTQLYFSDESGPDIMWMGNDGGIFVHRLSTGVTVSAVGNSTTGLACSEIDYLDAKANTVAIGLQDNGNVESVDSGNTWEFIPGGDGADVEIFEPFNGDIFYNEGVYSTAPSWRTYRRKHGSARKFTNNPAAYMPRLYYSIDDGFMYTHDNTSIYAINTTGSLGSWLPLYSNWHPAPFNVRNIWSSYSRESAFWITYWGDGTGTGNGDEDLSYIFLGSSGWDRKNHIDFNPTGDPVVTVTPSREWPDEAWVGVQSAAGNAKIFHLRNGGDVITDITGNLDSAAEVRTIEVMPFNPDVIWAGTDLGVFQTTDGGANWAPFMDGLPIGRSAELKFVEDTTHTGTHKLLLGIDGRGIWQRDISLPPIIFVDRRVASSGNGSRWAPYKTVAEGVAAATNGAIIAVHTDVYTEPRNINRNVRLMTWGGQSVIH